MQGDRKELPVRVNRSNINNHDDGRVAIAEVAARQDAFESDLRNISGAVLSLGKRIDEMGSSINAKIDQRSQPQWQTYIAGAMLLGGLFFAFIAPIQHDEDSLHAAVLKLDSQHRLFEREVQAKFDIRSGQFVTIREHDEFKTRMEQQDRQILSEIDKIENLILKLLDNKKQISLNSVQ